MKRKSGFTLMETVISMALFATLMVILFGAVNGFQRNWLKEYSKQDISASFVRTYRAIDSDLSSSSSTYFHYYNEDDASNASNKNNSSLLAKRWFMFPRTSSGVNIDGYPKWKDIVVYYLKRPNNDKCKKSAARTNVYCPHKQLVRVTITLPGTGVPATTESGSGNFNAYLRGYLNDIPRITDSIAVGATVDAGTVTDIRTINSDIVDLTIIEKSDGRVSFDLMLLRIIDAQKYITIGETPLIEDSIIKPQATSTAKKYLEETSWVTLTRNI